MVTATRLARSLTPARRRAQELASALEEPNSDVTLSAESQRLVSLAARLRTVETPPIRDEFAAGLRARLVTAAERELTRAPAADPRRKGDARPGRRAKWRARLLSAATAIVILAAGCVGVTVASQSALPGTVLYPVKRAIGTLRVDVAGSPAARGQDLLDQAATRLHETRQLAVSRRGQPDEVPLVNQTLGSFQNEASSAARLLLTSYRQTRATQTVRALRTFAHTSATTLARMDTTLPRGSAHALAAAAVSLLAIDQSAQRACAACSSLPVLTVKNLRAILALPPGALPASRTTPGVPSRPGSALAPGGSAISPAPAPTALLAPLPTPAVRTSPSQPAGSAPAVSSGPVPRPSAGPVSPSVPVGNPTGLPTGLPAPTGLP